MEQSHSIKASSEQRYPSLDIVRIVGNGVIFFGHFDLVLSLAFRNMPLFGEKLICAGHLMLDVFFLQSGYLVAKKLFAQYGRGDKNVLRRFYLWRAARIAPLYYATVLFSFAFLTTPTWTMAPVIQHLTFTMNFFGSIRDPLLLHAWSLCVEEHFYLLLPLVFFLLSKGTRKTAVIFAVLLLTSVILMRVYVWQTVYSHLPPIPKYDLAYWEWSKYFEWPTYTHIDGFIFGVGMAAIQVFAKDWWNRLIALDWLWLIPSSIFFALAMFCAANKTQLLPTAFVFTLASLFYACLQMYCLSPKCPLNRLKHPFIGTLSILTFPIYLIHVEVIRFVLRHFQNVPVLALGLSILMTISVAYVMQRVIADPFQTLRVWADRRLSR